MVKHHVQLLQESSRAGIWSQTRQISERESRFPLCDSVKSICLLKILFYRFYTHNADRLVWFPHELIDQLQPLYTFTTLVSWLPCKLGAVRENSLGFEALEWGPQYGCVVILRGELQKNKRCWTQRSTAAESREVYSAVRGKKVGCITPEGVFPASEENATYWKTL